MPIHNKTLSSLPNQRIHVNEVDENNLGQQGPGREWTEWHVYAEENGVKIGAFRYEDRDSAIINACQWAKAIGQSTVQLQKEGVNTREIDADNGSSECIRYWKLRALKAENELLVNSIYGEKTC